MLTSIHSCNKQWRYYRPVYFWFLSG